MRSSEEGQREGSDPGREDMPAGPIWNPHAYWRGHRPIRTPTPTGGVTGPSGPPHLLQGSQAHLDPHTFWRGHRPIWIPTPTAGVTGPGLQNLMGPLPHDPGAV